MEAITNREILALAVASFVGVWGFVKLIAPGFLSRWQHGQRDKQEHSQDVQKTELTHRQRLELTNLEWRHMQEGAVTDKLYELLLGDQEFVHGTVSKQLADMNKLLSRIEADVINLYRLTMSSKDEPYTPKISDDDL